MNRPDWTQPLAVIVEVQEADFFRIPDGEPGLFEYFSNRTRLGLFIGQYLAAGSVPFSLPEQAFYFLRSRILSSLSMKHSVARIVNYRNDSGRFLLF